MRRTGSARADGVASPEAELPGVGGVSDAATQPPAVTVVVPVYNPGRYLERCLRSLFAQTLSPDDWEVVFVDDGSTDGSPARLDDVAAAHPTMRVVHQANSGWPGQPRNLGIDLARGRYVQFLDDDDALGPEALERLVEFADRHRSDIVIGKTVGHGRPAASLLFTENRAAATIHDSQIIQSLTPHKLFRTAFLREHGIRFPEGRRRLEDHVFVLEAYFAAATISILADYPCYHHLARGDHANAASGLHDPSGHFDPAYYNGFLAEVLGVVEAHTEPGPARDRLLRRFVGRELLGQVQGWSFGRLGADRRRSIVEAAQVIADRYVPATVDAGLAASARVAMALLRAGRADDLASLARGADRLRLGLDRRRLSVAGDGRIELEADAEVFDGRRGLVYGSRDDRLLLPLPGRIARSVPEEARVLPDPLVSSALLVLRRADSTEILVPATAEQRQRMVRGGVRVVIHVRGSLEADDPAWRAPWATGRWDLILRLYIAGTRHDAPVRLPAGLGRSRPVAFSDGRPLETRAAWHVRPRVPTAVKAVGLTRAGRAIRRVVGRARR